ncbi:MAG: SAM-dependent methyltransferase [Methanosarcinaceae archaeon]|nr:SAM-dependent methyltransferase [Methanosarcinaceae archaeon]
MRSGKASWTSEITAVFRATESIRPAQVSLFHDKYAANFLRPSFRLILKNRLLAKFILWLMIDRRFPGATDTVVSRIRFVDDCLKGCIKEGVKQLVILGAGYDARAYRFSELKDKLVFEVDHPNTQRLKKAKITKIFGCLPSHVKFVPVDFEKDKLISKLVEAGYRRDLKTLFIWEGVCKYLTPNAVNELLSVVSGNSCKGSSIVFDYLFQSMVDRSSGSKLAEKALDFQAKKGEPFIFGLPEKNPEHLIMSRGFSSVKNFTAAKIKSMYFSGMARAKNLHPFWGIIHATV